MNYLVKSTRNILILAAVTGTLAAQDQTAAQPGEGRDVRVLKQELEATKVDLARAVRADMEHVVSGVINGPVVKDAPYSAEAVTETVQTLADGNRIVQRSSTLLYRDGQGRERREEDNPAHTIIISDPVEEASYALNPETKTARRIGYIAPRSGQQLKIQLFNARTEFELGTSHVIPAPVGVARTAVVVRSADGEAPNMEREELGTRTIEGVPAEGTRTVVTIPAGEIGNTQPIEIVDELWYSAELQTTVMSSHSDPRSGVTTYKLTNIRLVEPVPTLFEVPPDYTINGSSGPARVDVEFGKGH